MKKAIIASLALTLLVSCDEEKRQPPKKENPPATPPALTFDDVAGIYDNDENGDRIGLQNDGNATWNMVGSLHFTEFTYTIDGNKICLKTTDDNSDAGCHEYDAQNRTLKDKDGNVYKRSDIPSAPDATPSVDPDKEKKTEIAQKILKEKLHIDNVTPENISDTARAAFNHPFAGSDFRYFDIEDGNFSRYWYLYFYPIKTGGYEIIVEITNAGGDAYEPTYDYRKFVYSGGALTESKPVLNLTINDFYSNADKFPKKGADAIKKAIKESPRFNIDDKMTVKASFFPWKLEGDDPEDAAFVLPKALKGFENKGGERFPSLTFIWNGEQFVRTPDSKPIEEFLDYFKTRSDSIAMEIWDILSSDKKYAVKHHITGHSPTVAEFIAEGPLGFSETIACYKQSGDKWLVLRYRDGRGGANTLKVYDYDGNKLTERKKFFPKAFLNSVYITEFDAEGFNTYKESAGNTDAIYLRWNGEKFTENLLLPELVFDSLEFSEITYLEHPKVSPLIQNAKKVVIRGDKMTISDGKGETVLGINLTNASEEANPDAYYWMFTTIGSEALPETGFYILAEYEEACIARNLDPKKRPVKLFFENMGFLYPNTFNSWNGLRRKITQKYPSDKKYREALEYINREEDDPDFNEENAENSRTVHGDINHDGIKDIIIYTEQEINLALLDAHDVVTSEKKYKIVDENSSRRIQEVTINEKGVIVIKTTWINERGASGDDNYTIRYQDSDYYLIGYDSYYMPATNDSYNLLTYKKIRTTGTNKDDMKTETSTLKKIPLHRLSDIKIGEYHCGDYDGIE